MKMERDPVMATRIMALFLLTIIMLHPGHVGGDGNSGSGIAVDLHEAMVLDGSSSVTGTVEGLAGLGTEEDPYTIFFHRFNTSRNTGISIINSTFFIEIKYCLFDSSFKPVNPAIRIVNSSNVLIEGCVSYYASVGVEIRDSSFVSIKNSAWLGSYDGIYIRGHNVTVADCLCSHSVDSGIHMNMTRDVILENVVLQHQNAVLGHSSGIRMEDSSRNTIINASLILNYGSGMVISSSNGRISSHNRIIRSFFSDNNQGLIMSGCANSSVEDCEFRHNTNGIYTSDTDSVIINGSRFESNTYGVFLTRTDRSQISASIFESNDWGAWLDSSDHNRIFGNRISNCTRRSLTLDSWLGGDRPSSNNTVHLNIFEGETMFSSHAMDNGQHNMWDLGGEGNGWPDHTVPDLDGDGIVDMEYLISGNAGSTDHYPLASVETSLPDEMEEGGTEVHPLYWWIIALSVLASSLLILLSLIEKPAG